MSRRYPKNPRTPPTALTVRSGEIATYTGPLWRIHTTTGAHPAAWNALRRYGPLSDYRWEPHPPPPRTHPAVAVSYTAQDYETAFAEVFQRDRAITLTPDRTLSGWLPSRPLALLDVIASNWALRHRASASLPHTPKNTCRAWANAIWEQLGHQVDGLLAPSTVLIGKPMVVLFPRAASAFPIAPSFSRNLNHSDVATLAVRVGRRLDWPVR